MILLDTHVLVWALQDDPRLGPVARSSVLAGPTLYSVASLWEIAIKHARGRMGPPQEVLDAARRAGLRELAVEAPHVLAVVSSPLGHADPFDRLLVAQAQVEGLRLLTADGLVLARGLAFVDDARV